MFMLTMQWARIKKVVAVCASVAVITAVAVAASSALKGDELSQDVVDVGTSLQTKIEKPEQLSELLLSYGVETDLASAVVSQVKVPNKWDDDFEAFNEVIKQSGLDLKSVKNKEVDKWQLLVPSKTTENSKTYAIVLLFENKVSGLYYLTQPDHNVLPMIKEEKTGIALNEEEIETGADFGADQQEMQEVGATIGTSEIATIGSSVENATIGSSETVQKTSGDLVDEIIDVANVGPMPID